MSAYLRYDLFHPTSSWTPVVHSFPTETHLRTFVRSTMPAEARNVDMWWSDESPRQQPTTDPTWQKPSIWEEATGKRLPIITCPVEITHAQPERRRRVWA